MSILDQKRVLEIGRNTSLQEIEIIQQLAESIDTTIWEAAQLLMTCQGIV
jgi:hypothetical protein